ncbi:acetyltransferase [Chryseobacterium sp. Ch-15]|uniref:Acetyltransferase n=1 Tax=Chryseobacterium muglaense TaxID=2893752 RepID=A0A9Q3V016_9FLAO|nr:acetyltransferase [Chryseobacterium muglaense]MBD3905463.1 acetyltransferase [Chryseobacterium muglaense]MCC9036464.1 acetyltransferase [Chryseobacterium muglaense]MCM2555389.1 acetyltransferase [Chryseobacterium muglaense]
MKKIAILGAGGFGREVKTIIDAINKVNPTYDFIGFFDDGIEKGSLVNNYNVLGGISDINQYDEDLSIVICIADPKIKKKVISKINNSHIDFPSIIHPKASITDEFVTIGKGCIICEGTIITCNIEIKDFIILNLMCTVGHDTVIEDYCSFMPSVNISGEVKIEQGVYVGTGAKIINLLDIGENTIVGAGAVVSKSLPANCTAVGIPAKPIKFHE